jgi:hypothetical protein
MPNGFKFLSEAEKILSEQGFDGNEFVKWCKKYHPPLDTGCYGLADLNSHANTWLKVLEEERRATMLRRQLTLF